MAELKMRPMGERRNVVQDSGRLELTRASLHNQNWVRRAPPLKKSLYPKPGLFMLAGLCCGLCHFRGMLCSVQ
jgi:hypothetical protein